MTPDSREIEIEFESGGRQTARDIERLAPPKSTDSEIDGTVRIVRSPAIRRHTAIGRKRPEAAGSKRPHLVYALRNA